MAFHSRNFRDNEVSELAPKFHGPVLSLSSTCAEDPDEEAIFVSLGGQPSRKPSEGEPPGHFNLFWRDSVVGVSGYSHVEARGESGVEIYDLCLSVPAELESSIAKVADLVKDGLAALLNGMSYFPLEIEVNITEVFYRQGPEWTLTK